MATITYTVKRGDTLWKIAQAYNTTVNKLVELNDIDNPDLIHTGQVLIIEGTAVTTPTNTTSKATIKHFGLQANTDRTVFATWTWDKENTENYQVMWYYATGDGIWFIGSDSTVDVKQSTYNAPSNATKVKFKVKPISKKKTVKKKETSYWTASWSTEKKYNFSDNPPSTPPVPDVKIEKYKLTATLDNLDVNASKIEFQVVSNDSSIFAKGTSEIKTNHAAYSCTVKAGTSYKVRARSYRDDMYSDWSEYSDSVDTLPSAPDKIEIIRANSETSVYLKWTAVSNAKTYEIEYATEMNHFDGSDGTTTVGDIETNHYEKTGLETGDEYFFRVRAVNDGGESAWSEIKSVRIGIKPTSPTTWSSTTTAITGEPLILYWIHNAEDGSNMTRAEIETIIDGVTETVIVGGDPEEKDGENLTKHYEINTTDYPEGTKILWRVRTAGVTEECGEWSIQRTVDVYAPPTLELVLKNFNGETFDQLGSFPLKVTGIAGPNTQHPIGYHLTIVANESYETVDNVGNFKMVSAGEEVYSRFFDANEDLIISDLETEISASDVNLDNNISYTVACRVTMNSGLTADAFSDFTVAWTDNVYEPNAEIIIDPDTLSAHIRPYCEDEFGVYIQGITLSVYRREYDGKFTEIGTGISNSSDTFVTDPHPALDYARYRIVAITDATGGVSYCDLAGVPIAEISTVIQWNEAWSNFDTTSEDDISQPAWSGSMLKIPYNIDVSDSNSADVSLVEYIGREHPVSYYGTQRGVRSTWNMVIPKEDKETLYGLRRLAAWMGDVYVREPSGSGYWANVSVSFSQKHKEVTIPITLDITRVEGGV